MPCGFLNLVAKWAIPSIFPTIFFCMSAIHILFYITSQAKKNHFGGTQDPPSRGIEGVRNDALKLLLVCRLGEISARSIHKRLQIVGCEQYQTHVGCQGWFNQKL
jgi:hypothetical protein